ncbi:MAG: hypothetical protein ACRER8_22260 [Pseudomonas sp.]|uniref:hypothetical protein n=1 Tax=Pseudomonas sp. TaxID=306 RepID=UPI003D6FFE7E
MNAESRHCIHYVLLGRNVVGQISYSKILFFGWGIHGVVNVLGGTFASVESGAHWAGWRSGRTRRRRSSLSRGLYLILCSLCHRGACLTWQQALWHYLANHGTQARYGSRSDCAHSTADQRSLASTWQAVDHIAFTRPKPVSSSLSRANARAFQSGAT